MFLIFFSVQNLGHCRAKQKMIRSVGLKMDEKQSVTFALFSTFLNPQRVTLTYSALRGRDLQSDSDLDSIRNSCDVLYLYDA